MTEKVSATHRAAIRAPQNRDSGAAAMGWEIKNHRPVLMLPTLGDPLGDPLGSAGTGAVPLNRAVETSTLSTPQKIVLTDWFDD